MRGIRLSACLGAAGVLLLMLTPAACSKASTDATSIISTSHPASTPASTSTPGFTIVPVILEPAPREAVALELWKEFEADEVAALARYEGKTLHFARVKVDKMSFLGEGHDQELYVQEGIEPDVETVKFRTDLMNDIINVRENYIVEIEGKVQGMQFGYLIIRISWLKVIDPPGGDPNPPAEY